MEYTKGKWEVDTNKYGDFSVIVSFKTDEADICDSVADIPGSFNNREGNANLIVSAVNACIEINPQHPELVAENIKGMYEALRAIKQCVKDNPFIPALEQQIIAGKCYLVLSKIGGK